jgi:hypothetical protein
MEKIAFAVFTRNIMEYSPILDFLENAKKYQHQVEHLIIIYNDYVDQHIIEHFKTFCQVTAIQLGHKFFIHHYLKDIGLTEFEINNIICTPNISKFDLVPYGTARNYALIAAMYLKMDYLFFFDSDVFPKILTDYNEDEYHFGEVDFIGSHLKYLKKKNVVVTTSDYSGYYVIPKMNFPHLKNLLLGVQQENRFDYITTTDTPVTRNFIGQKIMNTHKILGGNMAIDLSKMQFLPPFFSTTLILQDQCFLGRGEDTLFGPVIYQNGGLCLDIDLLVFHNCFGDFPVKPLISIPKNLDRFFFACMGWIIRNPFFNWLQKKYGYSATDIDLDFRLSALKKGSNAAAKYFADKRFLILPEAFQMAYQKLPDDINYFENLLLAWDKMKLLMSER